MNRNWKVANEVLSLLNVIIEERISSIYTFNIQFDAEMVDDKEWTRCGCVIACPEDVIKERENRLKKYGFWSRILPFYIEYTNEDLLKVHEEIKEGKSSFSLKNTKVPDDEIDIRLPKEVADKLDPIVFAFKELSGLYSRATIYRRIEKLKELRSDFLFSATSLDPMTRVQIPVGASIQIAPETSSP